LPPPLPAPPVVTEQPGWGSSAGDIAKRVAAAAGSAALGAANVAILGPEWEPGQVVRQRDEKVEVNVSSAPEAKLAIKELRLIKKEWQAKKKELAAIKAEENARWRERQAGRITTTPLGRGRGGRIMRGAIQGKRRGERMEHAEIINNISAQQAAIDRNVMQIDSVIAQMEALALRNG
jgi:hypothetical protein